MQTSSSTAYKWKIENLNYLLNEYQLKNVVISIDWRLIGTKNSVSSEIIGTQAIEFNPEHFIDYTDLTEKIVFSWLESAMGLEQIKSLKNLINAQIEMQLAPQTDAGLPWVA